MGDGRWIDKHINITLVMAFILTELIMLPSVIFLDESENKVLLTMLLGVGLLIYFGATIWYLFKKGRSMAYLLTLLLHGIGWYILLSLKNYKSGDLRDGRYKEQQHLENLGRRE